MILVLLLVSFPRTSAHNPCDKKPFAQNLGFLSFGTASRIFQWQLVSFFCWLNRLNLCKMTLCTMELILFFSICCCPTSSFSCNTARPLLCWCNNPSVGSNSTAQHPQETFAHLTAWSCGRLSKGSSPSVYLGRQASRLREKLWSLKFLPFAMGTVSHHWVSRCWFFEGKIAGVFPSCRRIRRNKKFVFDSSFVFVETSGHHQIWATCWTVGTKDIKRYKQSPSGTIQNHHVHLKYIQAWCWQTNHAIHANGLSSKLGKTWQQCPHWKITSWWKSSCHLCLNHPVLYALALPETNSLPLKSNVWFRLISFRGPAYFQGWAVTHEVKILENQSKVRRDKNRWMEILTVERLGGLLKPPKPNGAMVR